ncbi:histone deacetylase family protein [Maritalea mediterranea]|uniref:Histone deacetylase family protein n=1 Tax=Maritalea mediterranea TaxID=2909667 RepID=A0ABS9E9V4_9HYPH|nr:histone deacetylase family protein [Maritalea mediterranea]MCF4099617.1 histone deacetylase family protein [Maritalea mediterranea]
MKLFFSPDQMAHNPQKEISDGKLVDAVETPQRAQMVFEALKDVAGVTHADMQDFGRKPIEQVHDTGYIDFLHAFGDLWVEAGREGEGFPFVWPGRDFRTDKVPHHLDGKLGHYSFDAGTPLTGKTYGAAYASAQSALNGADALLRGDGAAFSLCRPPGHHAGKDYYGGYCFFNNAAIAAQYFRDQGAARVSIFDVDYHHGNGTQSIFYHRNDVQFLSVHADPLEEYPYFLGHADERGTGMGEGFNFNYPLPLGTEAPTFLHQIQQGLTEIDRYDPDYLVISLGVDFFEGDPISQFKLTHPDMTKVGALLRTNRPTLFVMEGGYAVGDLGRNVAAIIAGFLLD